MATEPIQQQLTFAMLQAHDAFLTQNAHTAGYNWWGQKVIHFREGQENILLSDFLEVAHKYADTLKNNHYEPYIPGHRLTAYNYAEKIERYSEECDQRLSNCDVCILKIIIVYLRIFFTSIKSLLEIVFDIDPASKTIATVIRDGNTRVLNRAALQTSLS